MIFVSTWQVFCLDDPKQLFQGAAVYTISLWLNHIPWEVINFRIIRYISAKRPPSTPFHHRTDKLKMANRDKLEREAWKHILYHV